MPRFHSSDVKIIFLCVVLSLGLFLLDISMPPEFPNAVLYTIVIFVGLFLRREKFIFVMAAFLSVLLIAGACLSEPSIHIGMAALNRALETGLIWVVAVIAVMYKRKEARNVYLAAVVDSSKDAIIAQNLEGRITYWNKGAESLYGYSAAEVQGKPTTILVPDSRKEEIQRLLQKIRSGETIDRYETIRRHKSGKEMDVALALSPIETGEGEIVGASVIVRDITKIKAEQRRRESEKRMTEDLIQVKQEELGRIQQELKNVQRLSDIGVLAATVAHELRNPLGVIRTAIFNIKRKRTNEAIDKHIVHIERKISESEQIINNLLNYARIKNPKYQSVNVSELIEESLKLARRRFDGQNIVINKTDYLPDGFTMEADPVQITELLNNILNNAFQALTEEGQIDVDVRLSGDSHFVEVRIRDFGMGIDPADMDHIFKPFFTRKSKGTGLGLAICQEVASLHGGHIRVESEVGQWTEVAFRLPIAKSD